MKLLSQYCCMDTEWNDLFMGLNSLLNVREYVLRHSKTTAKILLSVISLIFR
jgi:hypothetical protein